LGPGTIIAEVCYRCSRAVGVKRRGPKGDIQYQIRLILSRNDRTTLALAANTPYPLVMTGPRQADDSLTPPLPQDKTRRPGGSPKPAQARAPGRPRPFVRRWGARLGSALLGLGGLLVAGGGFAAYVVWTRVAADLPSVDGLRGYAPPVMSRIYAGDGRLLAELANERRIFVPYAAIPERVRQAFVSAEDKDFWVHGGIDPLAIARAGMTDLTRMGEGRRPLGASTITQQVAKNMLLDNRMTLKRKVEEAILAIRMEQTLSKERILETYLNEIYLGQGAYGVQAAAQAYFNRPLDQLSLAQAAMLAALPKAPQNYNPFRHPDQARMRRDWVLDRMAEDRVITRAEADAAQAEKLVPAEFHGAPGIQGADWYAEEVRQELVQRFGAQEVNEGGLTVRTSLNPALQVFAETALRDGLMAYYRRMGGWRGAVTQLPAGPGLERGWPAALVGIPVGFVCAEAAKRHLQEQARVPYLSWVGRKGGSGVDTDALNALADNRRLLKKLGQGRVLTPHPGEMARLTGKTAAAVNQDREAIAVAAAEDWGAVVVLKGPRTVVAGPGGRISVDPHEVPALASGGTGDVLAGVIGGLLAQGCDPFTAAVTGVYVHAEAGRAVAERLGDSGLLASDLLLEIPPVMDQLRRGGL